MNDAMTMTLLNTGAKDDLPNMLYELVMGGMLITAFLPVYLSVKKQLGRERGNEYASNLLTIVEDQKYSRFAFSRPDTMEDAP